MANRLIHEMSPYLLEHAGNPVDWYPWGEEALQEARQAGKPILLSIGYSACHWCHVMARESFEDPQTARLMNEHFVNIKVDREERPDLDALYMDAVVAMTGNGGWPLTAFLTPEGVPFFGGTYFPPNDRPGMPGFQRVLRSVANAYRSQRDQVDQSTQAVTAFLRRSQAVESVDQLLAPHVLDRAFARLEQQSDRQYGGFGGAPKFPQPMALEYLLRTHRRLQDQRSLDSAEQTLQRMAHGGLYDQLGGGFHRYSVDARWLVPHFEKMLYDNALLSGVYLHAYQVTGRELYRRVVEETLDYVLREMTDPSGGFYSTQDADSEGEEGRYYLWTPEEVEAILGAQDARLFDRYFGVTKRGNFEGKNVLHAGEDPSVVAKELGVREEHLLHVVDKGRALLLEARERRVHPARDEKVLTAWNGLMLRSFAEAAQALGRREYLDAAVANARFVLSHLRENGRLLRSCKCGQARLNAYLEDYAFYADGLLALYEATFDIRWLDEAIALVEAMIARFADANGPGFFFTSSDAEQLVARRKDFFDNAVPSGNGVAADVLLRLSHLTGDPHYQERALAILRPFTEAMDDQPLGFGSALLALDFYLGGPKEVAIVGMPDAPDTRALVSALYRVYAPNKVVIVGRPGDQEAQKHFPLLADRQPIDGKATAYVCRNYTCYRPLTDPGELQREVLAA